MDNLLLKRIVYALYIFNERLITLFETYGEASEFAKKYYSNLNWHIEPYMVYTLKK